MILLRVLFLPISLAILATSAFLVPLPVFVQVPAAVIALDEVIEVDSPGSDDLVGTYLLTAASVARGTPARVAGALFDDSADLTAARRLVPPGVDDATFFAHQRAVFRSAADVASAVGLRAAGYPIDPEAVTGEGALVVDVVPGSPAQGALVPGDVIEAVDGVSVGTDDDLRELVRTSGAETVVVDVRRNEQERSVSLTPAIDPVRGVPVIGVVVETFRPSLTLPVGVEVDVTRVGGPSAGLLIALTVYDKASEEDLAAGRRIAGTGALDAEGNVQPVGGLRQKLLAASAQDVDVFLVPASQLSSARSLVDPGHTMTIIGAETFQQAVHRLREPAVGLARSATLGLPPWSTPGG